MTKVVHISSPYDVYIGRPSKWGNPFIIGVDGNRTEVIAKYREWIRTKPELLSVLPELKDKTLGCHCYPSACHGDVLAELANMIDDCEANAEPMIHSIGLPIILDMALNIGEAIADAQTETDDIGESRHDMTQTEIAEPDAAPEPPPPSYYPSPEVSSDSGSNFDY